MEIRFISNSELRSVLNYPACIEVIKQAMVEVSEGNVDLPLRHGLKLPKGMMGMMYGYLSRPECFGIKLVSLFPGNADAGLSSHMGLLVLYEAVNGKPIAIMDGSIITAVRTAAASAVATAQLAGKDAKTLAIVGSGEQAEAHIRAIPCVRDISTIKIWGRNTDKVKKLVDKCRKFTEADFVVADSVEDAVRLADIVCTVTSSPEPVLFGDWIEKGTHLNVVGSSFPHTAEIDSTLVTKASYFVDYKASTLAQAGEYQRAVEAGLINESHILAEIGEILSGKKPAVSLLKR